MNRFLSGLRMRNLARAHYALTTIKSPPPASSTSSSNTPVTPAKPPATATVTAARSARKPSFAPSATSKQKNSVEDDAMDGVDDDGAAFEEVLPSSRASAAKRGAQTITSASEINEASSPTFEGISSKAFPPEAARALQGMLRVARQRRRDDCARNFTEPIRNEDVEIKPDGTIYLPEIKYRRRLNQAFGPGAWALKPVSNVSIDNDILTRSYQLFWWETREVDTCRRLTWHNTALVGLSRRQLANSACARACRRQQPKRARSQMRLVASCCVLCVVYSPCSFSAHMQRSWHSV
jgi:hypothetical protein